MPIDHRPTVERFISKTELRENGCIEWMAYRNSNGYGRFGPGEGACMKLAHRWAYEFYIGPISEGLVIDHLCRNRSCVNPDHLEAVSQAVNLRRGIGTHTKTHCPKGHPYFGDNLRVYKGWRFCRKCQENLNREAYRRKQQSKKVEAA